MQQMREYKTALKTSFKPDEAVPSYVTVPPDPSLQHSARDRFALDGDTFTFMRRPQSRVVADWLLELLSTGKFASYIQGPQGVGKSHLLYEAVLLLRATPGCRVVYEHDCASWAVLAGQQNSRATLYFLRSVAMAFVDDAEVLGLCREVIANVAVMTNVADAEHAVCSIFLPRLGDLCKRLGLRVFFVFDQHNSLTPAMRETFPYSLPEWQLLHISQLRGSAMVTISASANNEYYLKIATLEPPLPTRFMTSGFNLDELRLFLAHERMFQRTPPLDSDQLQMLRVATNCFPLELAFLRGAHNVLQASGTVPSPVPVQRCIDVYEQGDKLLGVSGRVEIFADRITAFNKRMSSEPAELERLVNSVVCMKLELPLLTFPYAVLLNLAICYKSDTPQSVSFTQQSLRGGPAQYIHPVTPAALQAAVAFYAPDAAYSEREAAAVSFIFQSPRASRDLKGRTLETYILQQLSTAPAFELKGRKYGANKKLGAKPVPLADVRGVQTVRWYGELPTADLDVSSNLLLWPFSSKYPGVDGMLWLAGTKTLLLLQITLSAVGAHKSNFWVANETLRNRWVDKLGPKLIHELWLTPYTSAGDSLEHVGQYACTLAELLELNKSLFPLMQKWEPASEVLKDVHGRA